MRQVDSILRAMSLPTTLSKSYAWFEHEQCCLCSIRIGLAKVDLPYKSAEALILCAATACLSSEQNVSGPLAGRMLLPPIQLWLVSILWLCRSRWEYGATASACRDSHSFLHLSCLGPYGPQSYCPLQAKGISLSYSVAAKRCARVKCGLWLNWKQNSQRYPHLCFRVIPIALRIFLLKDLEGVYCFYKIQGACQRCA